MLVTSYLLSLPQPRAAPSESCLHAESATCLVPRATSMDRRREHHHWCGQPSELRPMILGSDVPGCCELRVRGDEVMLLFDRCGEFVAE